MDSIFVIQSEYMEDKHDIDGMIYYKLLQLYTNRNLDKYVSIKFTDIKQIINDYRNKVNVYTQLVPIGNLDFIKRWLQNLFNRFEVNMNPIEVPEVLRKYTERDYQIVQGNFLRTNLNKSRLFIKDATELKKWNNLVYQDMDITKYIDDNRQYVVSEYINIVSEYRLFVKDDSIISCNHYMGDVLVFPDSKRIKEMIEQYKKDIERPKAYTLDIAVMKKKNKLFTVPLEVHPFVSCGLYGLFSEDVLYMLRTGFEYYVKQNQGFMSRG